MKKWIISLMGMSCMIAALGQESDFRIEGSGSAVLPVTVDKMTNIVFPGPIQTAVKVSRDILAQKVRGVENVIELKAIRRGFAPTNLSVYGRDGRLYSFMLKYVDDTAVLNYRVTLSDTKQHSIGGIRLTGLPVDENQLQADAEHLAMQAGFMHNVCKSGGLRFSMEGIWFLDSLQWFVFALDNRSPVTYHPGRLRCYLKDDQRIKRRASQVFEIAPVYVNTLAHSSAEHETHLVAAFDPFTVPKGKHLVIELRWQDGRMLEMHVKGRVLMRGM